MKPWIRMYRAERGTFAQLPLVARGIAMEILKLTDDTGSIRLGNKSPVDAIAFALGATRADRRALAQYVPALFADGFMILQGSTLVVPNFARFQGDDGAPKRPRTDNDGATVEPRTDHEPTTTVQRTDNDNGPKCPESHVGTERALIRVDKSRVEEEAYARPVNAMAASLDPATSRAVEAYRDGIGDATGKRIPVAHAGRFAQAAELLAALDGTEADKLGTIRRAAAVAAKDPDHRKANVPFAWFCRNVGRYSGQAETPDTEAIRAKLRKLAEDEHGARMRFDHDLGDKLQAEAKVLRRQLAGVS